MRLTWLIKRNPSLSLAILITLIVFAMVAGQGIYAALTVPEVVDTVDYFGTEPFKGSDTLRTSVVLTNAYVDTDTVNLSDYTAVALLFDITKGSLTSIQYRIWVSYDNLNWYVEATETVGAGSVTDVPGVYTTTSSENYFKILNMYPPYMKLEVKGTGTVTGSLLAVDIVGVM